MADYESKKGKVVMDNLSPIRGIPGVFDVTSAGSVSKPGAFSEEEEKVRGTLFDSFLNAAIDNIKTTNTYFSDAEDEKIKFALGETETSHDLSIALQKASTALQYTVAIRDRLLDAYKEIMQMQI